jgi:cell division GTPase FtsZ
VDGGSNLTLDTFERILQSFRRQLGEPREMVVGTRTHEEPREILRLTAVVGGLKPQSVRDALGRPTNDSSVVVAH